ncbi:UNVERIFIED_CONTAM: putative E3 ubiquitin-protein ligase XBAT31 [Sesamum radiatum]|uniref:RING-type E3 ubiquitin transferase n=1 Tax=Sesamum radiatum TaxID=300843 RepID=A0AAW2KV72_SESRA
MSFLTQFRMESLKQLKQWRSKTKLVVAEDCSREALCTPRSFYAFGSVWKSGYLESTQTDTIDVSCYAWKDFLRGKADSSRSKSYYGHSDCLQFILSAAKSTAVAQSWGFSRFVNIRDGSGATPLHLASRQRRPDCVHILLSNGALVCASTGGYSYPGSTPLHLAARGGSLDCVRELLAWGADRLQRDSSGRIPYMVALKHKHEACAALLNPLAPEPLTWPSPLKFISELNSDAKALLEKALIEANKKREKAILMDTPPLSNSSGTDDESEAGDAELCCICFEHVCTIEVQNCGHQMCANCILALCCHSKPNSSTNSAKIPVCPFCRSSITRLVVAKSKIDSDIELELSPSKPRRARKSYNLGECSSSLKSLSSLGSFGRLGRTSGKVAAESNEEFDKL